MVVPVASSISTIDYIHEVRWRMIAGIAKGGEQEPGVIRAISFTGPAANTYAPPFRPRHGMEERPRV
jgi:hypothetical protein